MLVQRRTHDSLSNDEYYVIVGEATYTTQSLPEAIRKDSILVVTRGAAITLKWTTPDELVLRCDRCGIEKIDIIDRKYTWNSIHIRYEGFPNGTAYSSGVWNLRRDYRHVG